MNEDEPADFRASTNRWFALAARLFGWRPRDFWQATPAELIAALTQPDTDEGLAAPGRETIERMMERDTNG
ncbi:phage tail assembly chaperone [Erythrobacter sp.]|uniref:phage tail assembly chaperone n=1 Tax=Erythrobacter sp. TaxID=1042 RepID=UPI002EBF904C|nr:phage tail assembly chaperone [Erythrobacter sp.]